MRKLLGLAISLIAGTCMAAGQSIQLDEKPAKRITAPVEVKMNLVNAKGIGSSVGTITITQSDFGLVFTPKLMSLSAGFHGFHLHENASCEPKEKAGKLVGALAAGGHYDPRGSKKHDTPWGNGHLGDLPSLYVSADGRASQAVLAPRVGLSDLVGRSIMIHAGGDNHSDHPSLLGGGGARVACGVIK